MSPAGGAVARGGVGRGWRARGDKRAGQQRRGGLGTTLRDTYVSFTRLWRRRAGVKVSKQSNYLLACRTTNQVARPGWGTRRARPRRIPARGWWLQRDTPNVTKCHEQQKEKGEKGAHRQRAHRQRGWKLGGHQAAPVGKAVKTHINALALPQKVMANVLKLASPRSPDPTITYVMLCYVM